jgi:hypothetical protein
MGILDEIARGGRTSALDVVKAGTQGRMDIMNIQAAQQKMQMDALKTEEWLEERDRESRLRSSLEGAAFTTPEETREASQIALGLGEFETAMKMEELALKQVPKKDKHYGNMIPIYSGNEMIGYAQKDQDNKLHNFKTLKSLKGKDSLTRVTKPARPSKEQIGTAVDWAKASEAFGEEGVLSFGFSSKDYQTIGRTIASRAQKLIVDAKQLNQSISDEEAMDLAAQEIENMGSTIYKEDIFGRSLKKDITFDPGMSSVLQNFFGIYTEKDTGPPQDKWEDNEYHYRRVNGKVQRRRK